MSTIIEAFETIPKKLEEKNSEEKMKLTSQPP